MTLFLCILGALLLLGLAAVSVSLLELDRRLGDLTAAMDGRYGVWMKQSAEEKQRSKENKDGRRENSEAAKARK